MNHESVTHHPHVGRGYSANAAVFPLFYECLSRDVLLVLLNPCETKLLAHGPFLELLKEHGRQRAGWWLAEHGADIGQRSSIDLQQLFT